MAKHKYIETPDKMWELFEAYRKEVKDNPRTNHVFVGKDGLSKNQELERPLTMEGFYEYVCERKDTKFETDSPDLSDYFENKDERYNEYIRICSRIKRNIRQDQIEGGMVGQYNPSITQRLNGLTDKQDVTSGGEKLTEVTIKIVGGDTSN
jgi:hypothetical protein